MSNHEDFADFSDRHPGDFHAAENEAANRFALSLGHDDIDLAADSWERARQPLTRQECTARQRRIADAKQAVAGTQAAASAKPAGGYVTTAQDLAAAMRAMPSSIEVRRRAVGNAIQRVFCRQDVTLAEKLVFERIAWAATYRLNHAFDLGEAIAFQLGFKQKRTVHDAIDRLAALGLVFKFHEDQRVFTVPAFLPCDIDGSLAKRINETTRAINVAGVAYPHREAVKLAEATPANERRDPCNGPQEPLQLTAVSSAACSPNPVCSPCPGARNAPATRLLGGLTHQAIDGAVEIEQTSSEERAAGRQGSVEDCAKEDVDRSDQPQSWNATIQAAAVERTQFINRKELRADYERYVIHERNAFAQWLKGLRHADHHYRSRVGAILVTDDAITAFCCWERSRELKFLRVRGNSRKPLPESTLSASVGEFLTSATGNLFPVHQLAATRNGGCRQLSSVLLEILGDRLAGLHGQALVDRAATLLSPDLERKSRLAECLRNDGAAGGSLQPEMVWSFEVDSLSTEARAVVEALGKAFGVGEHVPELLWFGERLRQFNEQVGQSNRWTAAHIAQVLRAYRCTVDPDFRPSANAMARLGNALRDEGF